MSELQRLRDAVWNDNNPWEYDIEGCEQCRHCEVELDYWHHDKRPPPIHDEDCAWRAEKLRRTVAQVQVRGVHPTPTPLYSGSTGFRY